MAAGALTAMLAGAVPAAAQTSGISRAAAPQPTRVQFSLDAGHDRFASTPLAGTPPSNAAVRLRAEASHALGSRRASMVFWAGVTTDQGTGGQAAGSHAEAVRIDGGLQLGRRMRLEFSESGSRAPLDLFTAFGSVDATASRPMVRSSSELATGETLSRATAVRLTRSVSAQTSFALSAGESASQDSSVNSQKVRATTLAARVTRRSGPFSSWHAGYGLGDSVSSSKLAPRSARTVRHDLDAGVDYSRPLSFWEHTTVSFGTGSTLLTTDDGVRFRVNLSAALERQISSAWRARAELSRPVQVVAGFAEPLLSNAVRLSMAGRVNRRLTITATGGYARGTTGVARNAPGFSSVAAAVRATRTISPEWALEAEWNTARYRFESTAALPTSIPGRFARQGTRFRLVWSPAVVR
jgi:hypothetical protein